MHRLLVLLLMGCGSSADPAGAGVSGGSEGDGSDDGGSGDDGGSTGDDGGTGGDDTAAPEWVSLPADCDLAAADSTDPFTLTGAVKNTQVAGGWFTEILDIAWLPAEDRVLTTGQGGLVVFDLSDPADPITQGHEGAGGGGLVRYYQLLPAQPGLVWTTHREVGLDTLSVEDPLVPERLSRADGIGYEGLDRYGDRLYVASTQGFVAIYDVSDPLAPAWVGSVEGLGRPWDVHVVGEVAYVADGALGLVALDLSNPDAPTLASAVESGGLPVRLDDDGGDTLFMVSGAGGLEIFDLADPLAPSLLTAVDVGGSAQDVAYDDGLVGVTTQEAVVLLDVGRAGSPASPVPFSYQETEQFAMTLDAAGGTWTVGDWNILGIWDAGEGPAPATDVGAKTVAFLDEAETRQVSITNRGGAPLELLGLEVPDGVEALVSTTALAPGETGVVSLRWDGEADLAGVSACLATNDPDQPVTTLVLTSGADGEGKAIGQAAPDFSLQDLEGTTWRLSEQLGKPVVLAYFATW